MYNIGKYTFYDISDSEDTICSGYANLVKKWRGVEALFQQQADRASLIAAKSMYKDMVHSMIDKQAFINMINIRITASAAKIYEEHWLEFLGEKSYMFQPQIIRMDSRGIVDDKILDYIKSNNHEFDKDSVRDNLLDIHGETCLMFNMISSMSKEGFPPVKLNPVIADLLIEQFPGSFIAAPYIYIKYAPSNDLQNVLLLTRILHTYM